MVKLPIKMQTAKRIRRKRRRNEPDRTPGKTFSGKYGGGIRKDSAGPGSFDRIILSQSAFRIKFITIIICRNNICCYFCFRFTRSEGRKIPLSRPERLFFIKTPRMNRKDFHRPRPAGITARTETPLPPAGAAETAGGVPSPERNHGTDSYQSTHNN